MCAPLRPGRKGLTALEVVLVMTVCLPMAAAVFWLFRRAVARFFEVVGTVVGWPFL